jgi:Domain of unknown function (DUF4326)
VNTPCRIQRQRIRGWTAPLDTHGRKPVYVGRPTRFGSPFTITRDGSHHIVTDPGGGVILTRNSSISARKAATDWYRAWITGPTQEPLLTLARQLLQGRDLMCWCPLPATGEPDHCHAAVLLDLALDWETPMEPRTQTPDRTATDGGHTVTTIRVKRACNGCGRWLGDADARDLDDHGQLTDVRDECPNCADDAPAALTAGVRRLQQPATNRRIS